MAVYKDKRDKNDYRFLALWMFIGNTSNIIFDFLGISRPGSYPIVGQIALFVLLVFMVPMLLLIFDKPIGKRLIDIFHERERLYTIIGLICLFIWIVYIIYFFSNIFT